MMKLGNPLARLLRKDAVSEGAAEYWDQLPQRCSLHWTEHPSVAQYVNACITEVPWLSPTQGLKAGWAYHPMKRGLSIGCGIGNLERDLYFQRICERIEGIDISRESIRVAKTMNKDAGVRGIRYRVADFNRLELPPERYDIVFFHGSLHHVSDPDRLLDQVGRTLKPHGFLYVDEYVGPSRDEWTDDDLRFAREELAKLDAKLKLWDVNPPLDRTDPSEMIRSSRIVPAIRERFDVLHYKPYWGNLLFPLLCCVDRDEILKGENIPLVERLVARERELVERGEIQNPLFAVVFARKRM